ncbi:MAG: hypothetical protein Aurels2KO_09090 [Aureliella sp.]
MSNIARLYCRILRLVLLAFLVGPGATATGIIFAADTVDADEVLSDFPDTKWFDSETNTYLPPRDAPLRDNMLRKEGRVAGPTIQTDWWDFWDWDWWDSSTTGTTGGSLWGETFLTYFFYTLLFILFVAIVALLTWFLLRDSFPALRQRKQEAGEIVIDRARIEALPFEAKPDMGDPLAMAKRFRTDGQYDKALVYLYGYMLLALDQRQHIYLQKGKTNRMYLGEIGIEEMQQVVRPVQLAFEASFFGKHPIGHERFAEIWATLDTFHALAAREPVTNMADSSAMGVVA